jgi:predicted nucleic acid-binding protein
MLRAYLETTVFNRYFEEGREHNHETKRLFYMITSGDIAAFTSIAVLQEIDKAPEPKREKMISLFTRYNITVLEVEQSAYDLADLYVEMGVIPARFRLDGVHIAMSAVNHLDCIVSLNFHHINKLKTKTATEIIHRMKGCGNPTICTPMEVTDHDE